MGFSKKFQAEEVVAESEGKKKWFIPGVSIKAPLKLVSSKAVARDSCEEDGGACPTTPTARGSKISEKLVCPPAPRKRRPTSACYFSGVREFFNPPDLESIFIRHAERAN
ncbi:hypothetical protein OROGR_018355 [Orobanche gracilis]